MSSHKSYIYSMVKLSILVSFIMKHLVSALLVFHRFLCLEKPRSVSLVDQGDYEKLGSNLAKSTFCWINIHGFRRRENRAFWRASAAGDPEMEREWISGKFDAIVKHYSTHYRFPVSIWDYLGSSRSGKMTKANACSVLFVGNMQPPAPRGCGWLWQLHRIFLGRSWHPFSR